MGNRKESDKAMNTLLITTCAFALCLSAFADAPTNVVHITKEQMAAIVAKNGGLIEKPGTGLGCILFANEQRRVAISELTRPVDYIAKYTKLRVSIRDVDVGTLEANRNGVAKSGANILILVKDDAKSASPLLVSPDEAWAAVNVAALAVDNPKSDVLAFRLRKELSRAFIFLCGGVNTQYEKTPANYCGSLKDLDAIDMDEVPADLIARFRTYTQGYGVTPTITATYKTACKHGWAPAPTNDYQKAIWDKVHAVPATPMKIEFDPKKGR